MCQLCQRVLVWGPDVSVLRRFPGDLNMQLGVGLLVFVDPLPLRFFHSFLYNSTCTKYTMHIHCFSQKQMVIYSHHYSHLKHALSLNKVHIGFKLILKANFKKKIECPLKQFLYSNLCNIFRKRERETEKEGGRERENYRMNYIDTQMSSGQANFSSA